MTTPSTLNIDLNPHDLAEVQRILMEYVPQYEVWAFGSRVTWTAKAYSDLDLAIITDKPLSLGTLADLKNAFDESDLSIKVDLVDWATTGEAFRDIIKKTAVKIPHTTDWIDVPLGHVISTVVDNRGKTPPVTDLGPHELLEVNAVVGAVKTPDFSVVKKFVSDETFNTWFRKGHPKIGDVLFSTVGSIAEVAYVKKERGCIAQNLIALRSDRNRLSGEFLFYLLKNPSTKAELLSLDISSVQPSIKVPHLLAKHVKLPPLPEQRAIAHILGTLDDKIELNRRMNETLEAMARALFKSWFVDFEPVRAKAEGRDTGLPKEIADVFPDSFEDSELGEVPKGWQLKSLYDTATFINGAAFKNDDFCESGTGLPVIKISELKDGINAQTKYSCRNADNKQLINTGDLLYSWSGSPDTSLDVFIWANGPGLLNQHIFKVVTDCDSKKRFVYYLLKYLRPVLVEIARNKQTTGLGHITVADMKRLQICTPPPHVLTAFNNAAAQLFDKAFFNTLESRTLTTQRDALLPKLLSGEIRIA